MTARCLGPWMVMALTAAAAAGPPAEKPGIHQPKGEPVSFVWVRKDDHAFRWDIVDNGTVNDGSNDAYDGGMRLQVNDEYFPSLSSAWASQDNLEIEIGPWRRGQLAVSRRIFVNRQAGYCRWIDLFENTGGSEAELKVMYHSNMGQSTGDTYTSSGKAQLTEKDWGIVTGQAASATSYPSIVHVFATPAAKFRPSFHCTRGNDDLYYRATFKVPPRKAAALCFFEAQRRPFQEAVAFLKKFNVGQELRLVPAPLRRILLNMPGGMLTVEGIELNRNHEADTVVLRNGDEILGRISNPRFVVKTEFGELDLPGERVIGLVSLPGQDEQVQLVLADGQVIAGQLSSGPIAVRLAGGTELKIPAKGLAQAAYRLSPEKPEEVKAAGAMVVLRGGARLAFDAADRTFEFLTAHGPLKLAAADLRCIELDTPGGGLHQAVFRNGSVLAGLMPAERIQLKLQLGLPLDVARQEVRRLLLTAKAEDTKSPAMLTLRNEDVLAGEFADESWKVHTEFGPVSVTPPSVVNATFSRESPGQVKLLLRDGTRIGGKLADDYIRFRIQPGPELKIHVGHIDSAAGPAAPGESTEPAEAPPAPVVPTPSRPVATRRAFNLRIPSTGPTR